MMIFLIVGVAYGLAPGLTRRTALTTIATAAAPAVAAVYSKEEYCRSSDAESKKGIAYGCEEFATDPEKIASMRSRALTEIGTAFSELRNLTEMTSARDGALVRQALRSGGLSSLRRDGKRLIILEKPQIDLSDTYATAIRSIEALDLAARRLELDDGPDGLLTANEKLGEAKRDLQAFLDAALPPK